MIHRFACPFVAVDIGNTALKFGLFQQQGMQAAPLPEPAQIIGLSVDRLDELLAWLGPVPPCEFSWLIGSVQRSYCTQLLDWLSRHAAAERATLLTSRDLPMNIDLKRPDMVGIDRLLGAVAANRLRENKRPAVVIDLGTALKVDWVSAEGAFGGGAIMPGIAMSARALHEFTDLLPKIEMSELADPPPPIGTATESAMRSGLFWGAIGGVKELTAQMAAGTFPPTGDANATKKTPIEPQVFLTGGAAPSVAHLLTPAAIYLPHLVLQGIAVTAKEAASGKPQSRAL